MLILVFFSFLAWGYASDHSSSRRASLEGWLTIVIPFVALFYVIGWTKYKNIHSKISDKVKKWFANLSLSEMLVLFSVVVICIVVVSYILLSN